jgi:hypothetical protein
LTSLLELYNNSLKFETTSLSGVYAAVATADRHVADGATTELAEAELLDFLDR